MINLLSRVRQSLPTEESVGVHLHVFCSIFVSAELGSGRELLRSKEHSRLPIDFSGRAVSPR